MLRIKQIIKLLSEMSSFKPYNYKTKSDRKINKINTLLIKSLITLFIFLIASIILYKNFNIFNSKSVLYFIYSTYVIFNIFGIIILFIPTIQLYLFLRSWKKETANEFICEIDHDEENAKKLMIYQKEELLYTTYWLQQKIDRLNSRVSQFFGEKTAILSFLALCYSAVNASIGFGKLSEIMTNGQLTTDKSNIVILFGLAFLLGLSLGAIMLKKVADHHLYLKEVVELAIRLKKESSNLASK